MKKKLLFIAPDYYGFNEVVIQGLQSFSDYEVIGINSTKPYQYKNVLERINNLFLKTFKRRNLKKIKTEQDIRHKIERQGHYDLLLVNRPDILPEEILNLAISKARLSRAILWDSLKKVPQPSSYLAKFDNVLSFDPEDCRDYGFSQITNFYFKEQCPSELRFDVALLMTYDNRINDAIKLFNYFNKYDIKAKAKIFVTAAHGLKRKLPDNMEIITTVIPFEKSCEYYYDSKAILDLSHPHQKGLSFRPFEALGLQKKLITTAANVKSLDFYNRSNIFLIEDTNNIDLPKEFLEDEYCVPNLQIVKKYSLKSWVESII